MNKPAAIYARVSSDRQKESHTIGSQTSALVEYAQTHGYAVPSEWVLQDEGYSGASLVRPGLEALRDLAAQGQIVAVLIYSPDRLSRKYAYQVLLGEELSRCGVDVIYLKSPSGDSPEDQLVVQFQGMMAEHERAQIAERHRRGKRHRAQLRQRMPELNKKSQSVESELQSLETAAVDQARYRQLAESLDGFRIKLPERAKTLDGRERQQILRLLMKEVLVAADSLTNHPSLDPY